MNLAVISAYYNLSDSLISSPMVEEWVFTVWTPGSVVGILTVRWSCSVPRGRECGQGALGWAVGGWDIPHPGRCGKSGNAE